MLTAARQRTIGLLARRWPQGLYRTVGLLAQIGVAPARRRATQERLRVVFPGLSAAEARRAARDLHSSTLKSRALGVALAHNSGARVCPPICVDPRAAAIRGPAILTSFHVGPVGALGEVLRELPGEVLALHRMEWMLPGNVVGLYVDHTQAGATAALYRAVRTLRRGGCVLLLADGPGHAVSLLGRAATLRRGPYALARITGAPLVPLIARWNGPAIDVVCAETIAAQPDEAAMSEAMAAVLERHLRAHPAEIGRHLLDRLSRAPPRAAAPRAP